jgi:nucleotide-binding universal stress UspA family protein
MYKTIYVPVDNSDYSNQAISTAVALGKSYEAEMVGCHVYAAKMHDYRFKQMEYTLPDEYLEETELDRQRKIHDSLITMGLKLISDSYLDTMQKTCKEAGLKFIPKMMDGKHSTELIRDITGSDYDLVVMGVMGLGRVKDSQIGSVCERVTKCADKDVLVIKQLPEGEAASDRDTILVGIDGSPQSFGALMTAMDLAQRFDKKVEAIAVYDPYLHYSVFNSIVGVLTEKAAKVFRFEEQNQLHEEIIDTGLAQIYESHLGVAAQIAEKEGVVITKTLLDGKAFQKILDHARKTQPWLLMMGRIGVHSDKDEKGLGSNTENLLRAAPCDLLITTRLEYPELDIQAEESIRWTPEAEERMTRVPPQVVGIARTAIYRMAVEKGHSVITSDLLDEAMDRFMPKSSAAATEKLAEALVLQSTRDQDISICKKCGLAATDAAPVKCSVCNSTSFEVVTPDMVQQIIQSEGGAQTENTYDGRTLRWTRDAKRALWVFDNAYQRRRTKARIEKMARMRRMPTVTLEFARTTIEEESGKPLVLPTADAESSTEKTSEEVSTRADGRRLIARDSRNTPLVSAYEWTDDAVKRVLRVPGGFMRDRTQNRIEEVAVQRQATTIDLELVEAGIEHSRQLMAQMVQSYEASPDISRAELEQQQATTEQPQDPSRAQPESSDSSGPQGLNEVGVMAALQKARKDSIH